MSIKFIGGLNKIGLNSTIVEYNNSSIIIDYGKDIINNSGFSSISINSDIIKDLNIKAIFITHIHDDHIGSLFSVLNYNIEISIPIYCSYETKKYIESYYPENNLNIIHVSEGKHIFNIIDNLEIIPFYTIHSCFGSMGFYFKFDNYSSIFTGDIKDISNSGKSIIKSLINEDRKNNRKIHLFIETTNSISPIDKRETSEKDVSDHLENLIDKFINKNKHVIISCFGTEHHRLYNLLNYIINHKLNYTIIGPAIKKNLEAIKFMSLNKIIDPSINENILNVLEEAEKNYYLEYNNTSSYDLEDIKPMIFICTGSLGQKFAGLDRLILSRKINKSNFAIIISSSCIPGNEDIVSDMYNKISHCNFYRLITYKTDPMVHTSGHSFISQLINIIKFIDPDFIIPVHGSISQRKILIEQISEVNNIDYIIYKKANILTIDYKQNYKEQNILIEEEINNLVDVYDKEFYNKYLIYYSNSLQCSTENYLYINKERENIRLNGLIIFTKDNYIKIGLITDKEIDEKIKNISSIYINNYNNYILDKDENQLKTIINTLRMDINKVYKKFYITPEIKFIY